MWMRDLRGISGMLGFKYRLILRSLWLVAFICIVWMALEGGLPVDMRGCVSYVKPVGGLVIPILNVI